MPCTVWTTPLPELATQVVDIGVDGAGRVDTVEYRVEQLAAGEDLPRGAHQDAEQRRLTLGQFDRVAADGAPADRARHPVQAEPTCAQRRAAVGSAQQGPHPGEQFRYLERLDQVVLRSGVEALDPIRDRATRGEKQRRGGDSPRSKHGDQFGAVHHRQLRDRRSWRHSRR